MRLVVVGSGIVGAACAHAASGLGAEVTLVDSAEPGRATVAGAGIICPWPAAIPDPDWYSFARAAALGYPALIAGLAERGETEVSYRKVGALVLADDAARLASARRRLLARRADTPEIGEVSVLAHGEAERLFPPLRAGLAALHVEGAARVDGRLLRAALVRAASASGARVVAGRAGLQTRAGRVTGVRVDGELIEADAVVAAAGAWTPAFTEPAGVTVRVVPQRGQIMHIGLDGADTSSWPVIVPSISGHYMLSFDDSRVVAGATRETGSGYDVRVTPGGMAEVLENALAVAPGLGAGTHLETRVGLRPASRDGRPLLGSVPGITGLVVATGLGASGLTMGPYAGAVAARLAVGLPAGIDLEPYNPLR